MTPPSIREVTAITVQSQSPLSLYVHYPWCERKCPYCDFNSHESAELPEGAYIDALLQDLQNDLHYVEDRRVNTVFIGGGTPSLLSTGGLARLMSGIAERVELSTAVEVTMEANPGSAESAKFEGFRQAGVNRLSLGIQSFDDRQLQQLGRVHNSSQAHAAIEMAQSAGFDNFNLDLMHGLPGQSVASACADLTTALQYCPPHLSWYQLTIEPNTVFHKHPPELPVEDNLADIQEQGERLLERAALAQYEVSAYSQSGKNCRHNLNYWGFGDYLGIGAGAHGKVSMCNGRILRYSKKRQPSEYMAGQSGGYVANSRALEEGEIAGEFMLNALRLNRGFSMTEFRASTGLAESVLQPQLQELTDKNLLRVCGHQVSTTALGRRFLDNVVAEFFPD
ncbi:MAG: radical SAM family heme chaperone HemW [Halioglobus sp.]